MKFRKRFALAWSLLFNEKKLDIIRACSRLAEHRRIYDKELPKLQFELMDFIKDKETKKGVSGYQSYRKNIQIITIPNDSFINPFADMLYMPTISRETLEGRPMYVRQMINTESSIPNFMENKKMDAIRSFSEYMFKNDFIGSTSIETPSGIEVTYWINVFE